MSSLQLTCIDCGDQVPVKRSDARYCKKCRLRRDISFMENGVSNYRVQRKCRTCSNDYRMMHKSDWKICGTCKTEMASTVALLKAVECVWCSRPVAQRSALANICLGCQTAPDRRKKLMGGLAQGFGERRAQYRARLQVIADGGPAVVRVLTEDELAQRTQDEEGI